MDNLAALVQHRPQHKASAPVDTSARNEAAEMFLASEMALGPCPCKRDLFSDRLEIFILNDRPSASGAGENLLINMMAEVFGIELGGSQLWATIDVEVTAPTLDLVLGYLKANTSPPLKFFFHEWTS